MVPTRERRNPIPGHSSGQSALPERCKLHSTLERGNDQDARRDISHELAGSIIFSLKSLLSIRAAQNRRGLAFIYQQ